MSYESDLWNLQLKSLDKSISINAADPRFHQAAQAQLENHQNLLFFLPFHIPGSGLSLGTTIFYGITENSLLMTEFERKSWSLKEPFNPTVAGSSDIEFEKMDYWDFKKIKDPKGLTWAIGFRFKERLFQMYNVVYSSNLAGAAKFQEIFEVNANRFKAIRDTPDVAEQLSAMNILFQEGVLTQSEFQRSKELFLGKSADQEQQAERALRSLKQLRDAGVLTQAEFATKKWDVLSDQKKD